MNDSLRDLKVAHIKVGTNVRTGDLEVDDLAADIKAHGLLQPLLVRRTGDSGYELVAGHRRLAACKQIGLDTVPCLITDGHDTRRALLQLAENVQRQDLKPYDVAEALRSLRNVCDSIEDIARRVGKTYPWVVQHLDYAMLYDNLVRDGVEARILDRVPLQTLLELKALPSDQRAPALLELVSADAKQKVPNKAVFRKLVDSRVQAKREKRNAKPRFTIHNHGLVLTIEFETKLDVRRITNVLLQAGGRVG